MQITTQTSYKEFLLMVEIFHLTEQQLQEIFDRVKEYPLPEKLNVDFDELKFGQLCQLQNMTAAADLFVQPFWILCQIAEEELLKMRAVDCLRFVWHVREGMERITKLFEEIRYQPTAEEVRAGINKLDHGFFGTADWYARRMGITDHEQVFQTNWMRIYQAMKIDHENHRFEQSYRKVIEQQSKAK